MTQEQIAAEKKATADANSKAAEAKSKAVLEELKKIRVEDTRSDITKLAIYNPTAWELHKWVQHGDDTIVEYYVRNGSKEVFLCKTARENYSIKAGTHNDFNLTEYGGRLPPQVADLPGGTTVVQKITITFDTAMNRTTGLAEDKHLELRPSFVLKYERTWATRTTEEVP